MEMKTVARKNRCVQVAYRCALWGNRML